MMQAAAAAGAVTPNDLPASTFGCALQFWRMLYCSASLCLHV